MPLSEHNWEKFFVKQSEQKKKQEKLIDKKSDIVEMEKKNHNRSMQISPKNAHKIALKMLRLEEFKNILKNFVAEKIVSRELITRMDKMISIENKEEYLKLYGITHEHFKEITNNNLSSFDLIKDGDCLAITFTRTSGQESVRCMDNKVLAELLEKIMSAYPEYDTKSLEESVKNYAK